ncbi:MAG: hypothetical protein HUU34_06420 [Saprospiraceae bacterium]|jgi:hypothetical protein|nr:hypothetical protein [Saprospiraceae bacterium]
MPSANIEKRVTILEQVFADFMVSQDRNLTRLETEMRDFKDEMKDFKDEMKDFKDEMKDFKAYVEQDIAESKEERRQMTKQWGDLANKLGTVVEDIVFPASRPVLEKYFGEPIQFIFIHAVKKIKSLRIEGEYDVVAVSDKRVFIIEVKTTPRANYLQEFESNLVKFRKLFPEYNHLGLIPIFAGLRFEKPFIDKATGKGIYVMAYREWDYMDILNFDNLPLADATRY